MSANKTKRGSAAPEPLLDPGKLRITIRLDEDIVNRFVEMSADTGQGYQTLMNAALREYLNGKAPKLEDTLRRIVREELDRPVA